VKQKGVLVVCMGLGKCSSNLEKIREQKAMLIERPLWDLDVIS